MQTSLPVRLTAVLAGGVLATTAGLGFHHGGVWAEPRSHAAPVSNHTTPLRDTYPLVMVSATAGWTFPVFSIAHTRNGGQTWENVTPHGARPMVDGAGSVSTPSTSVAWILAENAASPIHPYVYRTTSAGHRWMLRRFTGDGAITAVNARDAWVLAYVAGPAAGPEAVNIYGTVDGGRTWRLLARTGAHGRRSFPYTGGKTGISFANRDDGVLTGYDANGRAWVYVTRDGGRRWQSADLTVPRSLAGNPITFGPAVFYGRRGHGVLVASNFAGVTVIYQTTDAGMHGALAGDIPGPVDRTVDVASARNMWATVNVSRTEQPDDVLYRSRDGGRTWRRVQGTLPPLLLELDFVSGRLGFASTALGLWKTTDGGKLWIKLLPTIRPSVRGRRLGRSSPPEAHRGRQLLALTCEPVRGNRGNVPRQRGIRASALRGFCTGGTRSQIWLPGSAPRGPLHPGG